MVVMVVVENKGNICIWQAILVPSITATRSRLSSALYPSFRSLNVCDRGAW